MPSHSSDQRTLKPISSSYKCPPPALSYAASHLVINAFAWCGNMPAALLKTPTWQHCSKPDIHDSQNTVDWSWNHKLKQPANQKEQSPNTIWRHKTNCSQNASFQRSQDQNCRQCTDHSTKEEEQPQRSSQNQTPASSVFTIIFMVFKSNVPTTLTPLSKHCSEPRSICTYTSCYM